MRTRPHIPLALVLALGLLSGCGKSGSNLTSPSSGTGATGTAVEQAEVSAVLADAPEIVEDGEFETPDAFSTSAMADGGVAGPLEAIQPLRWLRNIRHVERRFSFAFSDTDSTGLPTTAVVTIHKRLDGTLYILAGDPGQGGGEGFSINSDTSGVHLVRKPIEDHWVRRVLLKRVHDGGEMNAARGRWRAVASSGVEVTSKDAKTQIQSLRVQAADLDTTVTDPLAFWRLRRLIKVNAQEPVTLTVTTGASDNLLFLFSRGGRFRFHNNGDGTYTGTWKAPMLRGIRHVGVNAFSNGTLFDDTEPYDSNAWILPYVVTNDDLCDYLPKDMP